MIIDDEPLDRSLSTSHYSSFSDEHKFEINEKNDSLVKISDQSDMIPAHPFEVRPFETSN